MLILYKMYRHGAPKYSINSNTSPKKYVGLKWHDHVPPFVQRPFSVAQWLETSTLKPSSRHEIKICLFLVVAFFCSGPHPSLKVLAVNFQNFG